MSRRLFSTQIVDSDAFLDMSATAQNLYFHLGMRADDDGFVGNPKKISKICGANDDDLKILIVKRFILTFESGVVVIKHWLIHNTIRKDRYTETQYLEEKGSLQIKENKSYTEKNRYLSSKFTKITTIGQPNGNQVAPQVKLSKDKLSKVNIVGKANEVYSFKEKLNGLLEASRRDLHIIGLYWRHKGFSFANNEQYQSNLKRELVPVKNLVGYTDNQIIYTMDWLSENMEFKWTSETILKYINEDLDTIKPKKNGKFNKI